MHVMDLLSQQTLAAKATLTYLHHLKDCCATVKQESVKLAWPWGAFIREAAPARTAACAARTSC